MNRSKDSELSEIKSRRNIMTNSTGVCERWILLQTDDDTAYISIPISIQILFGIVYGVAYAVFFRSKASVTKIHMLIWYLNTSTWGWLIYIFSYLAVCQGPVDTPLCITALTFLGVFGLIGLIEICCSGEGGYFRHQMTMNECIEHMNKMRRTAPIHRIHVECYHYRTEYRTETYRDSSGNTQTRTITERKRVVTHTETRSFNYDRWSDNSDYPNLPEISMEFPIVAVQSKFSISPGDSYTRTQFNAWRNDFLSQMRRRDEYIDETEKEVLPGHIEKVSAKSEKEGEVPWWLSCQLFYCLALIFCSCPLRVLFRSKAKKHSFEIRKLYFVQPTVTPSGGNVIVNIHENGGVVNIGANIGVDPGGAHFSTNPGGAHFSTNPDGVVLQPNNLYGPPPTAPEEQAPPSYYSSINPPANGESNYYPPDEPMNLHDVQFIAPNYYPPNEPMNPHVGPPNYQIASDDGPFKSSDYKVASGPSDYPNVRPS